MKKVLVAGATGYLGMYLVQELKNRGYWVRVLLRKESQKKYFDYVDDIFIGQITKPETLKDVTKGIDWVFSTIGITRQKDGLTYMDVDYQGNLNLLRDAEKTNVDSFLYVSVLSGEKTSNLKIIQAKEKFGSELKQSSIQSCIVRPSGFFVDLKEFLTMAKKKKIYLIGNGNYKLNPISGYDLAVVCVDSMESSINEINVGGPITYTQNEIAELAFKALGIKGKIIHLSLWLRDVFVTLLRTFTSSKFYGPYEFFLTAMTTDVSTDNYGKETLEEFYKQEVRNNIGE